jgi:toxin ParE1/3/4
VRSLPLSEIAEADLEEIAAYIARDNPRAAVRIIDSLLDQCERVCANPLGYEACEYLLPGMRRAVRRPYLVLFVVNQDGVRIERIVHGARDLPSLFPPEG